METFILCFFGFAVIVILLVAILNKERAERVKSTAKMILSLLPIGSVVRAYLNAKKSK